MNPDIFFLVGILILALSLPLTLQAFTTSGKTFRPVVLCLLIGGGMLVFAMSQSTESYSLRDIPRIIGSLLR